MAEPWWIGFFVYLFTDRCMQSLNAANLHIFFSWLFVVGGKRFRVRAQNLTVVTGSGDKNIDLFHYIQIFFFLCTYT